MADTKTLKQSGAGRFWKFNRRIPKRLESILGSGVKVTSLGTSDLRAAQRLRDKINLQWDRLDPQDAPAAFQIYLAQLRHLTDDERHTEPTRFLRRPFCLSHAVLA